MPGSGTGRGPVLSLVGIEARASQIVMIGQHVGVGGTVGDRHPDKPTTGE